MRCQVRYAFLFSLPYASKFISPAVFDIGHYGGYTLSKTGRILSHLLEIWAFLKTRATQLLATKILQYVLQPREYVYILFVIATESTDSSP